MERAPATPERRGRTLATLGILIGIALGALDATVVGPAMPRIVASLQGVELYFLVTAAFMVTSTSTTPVWGRLLDLFGRRPFHLIGVVLFLGGSVLCGSAHSMTQLVLFRAIQGLGAGALIPVSFTMVADLYPLEERGKVQGFVAAVWGLSSIIGPPMGGFITKHFGWPWVFYVNVPIGLLSTLLVQSMWKEPPLPLTRRRLDIAGATCMLLAAGAFMTGCALLNTTGCSSPTRISFGAAALSTVLLVFFERQAADPFIAHDLFRIHLFSAGIACGACAAICLFCTTTYVTLFMQAVVGSDEVAAGMVLLPMCLTWVICSGVASPLSLRLGYRRIAIFGMALCAIAYALLIRLTASSVWLHVAIPMGILGAGLGSTLTPLLIAAQNAVPRQKLGAATSLTQFSRTICASIAIAIMGVVLTATIAPRIPPGLRPDDILNYAKRATLSLDALSSICDAIALGMHRVFLIGLGASVAGLACACFLPGGTGRTLAHPGEHNQPSARTC